MGLGGAGGWGEVRRPVSRASGVVCGGGDRGVGGIRSSYGSYVWEFRREEIVKVGR